MRILLQVSALLLTTSAAFSQVALYTFTGQVASLPRDGAGVLASQGFEIRDPVGVTFAVDFSALGQVVLNDGSAGVYDLYVWEDTRIEYFYARLLSGTRLPEVDNGMYNDVTDVQESLSGWNRSDGNGQRGVLQGGSGDSYVTIQRTNSSAAPGTGDWRVQDWRVGTAAQGIFVAWSDQDYSMIRADLRLESITPVPEPANALWLATGAIALGILARRKCGLPPHRPPAPTSPQHQYRRTDRRMQALQPWHYKRVLSCLLLAVVLLWLSGCMSPQAESDWRWKQMNPNWRSSTLDDGRPQWGPFQ